LHARDVVRVVLVVKKVIFVNAAFAAVDRRDKLTPFLGFANPVRRNTSLSSYFGITAVP
jgi:hypothetical protein